MAQAQSPEDEGGLIFGSVNKSRTGFTTISGSGSGLTERLFCSFTHADLMSGQVQTVTIGPSG